jgi:hypothetical protein
VTVLALITACIAPTSGERRMLGSRGHRRRRSAPSLVSARRAPGVSCRERRGSRADAWGGTDETRSLPGVQWRASRQAPPAV